jgi:hypothetical protein
MDWDRVHVEDRVRKQGPAKVTKGFVARKRKKKHRKAKKRRVPLPEAAKSVRFLDIPKCSCGKLLGYGGEHSVFCPLAAKPKEPKSFVLSPSQQASFWKPSFKRIVSCICGKSPMFSGQHRKYCPLHKKR